MKPWNDDMLSESARSVLHSRQADAYTRLVVAGDAGAGAELRQQLADLKFDAVLDGAPRSRDDAKALLAGLWLWHDFLEESHTISQGLHTPTGSYWHAIMHRREGDFPNAKYWYARCRNHPVLAEIAARAGGRFEPNAFVDVVERVHEQPADPQHARAVELQRVEWDALFGHCVRAAHGQG